MSVFEYFLRDIATGDDLLDLSSYATCKLQPRLDRPRTTVLTLPSDTPGLLDEAGDGDANLVKGSRALAVKCNGVLVAHDKIHQLSWAGEKDTSELVITANCPMMQLGRRHCFDDGGHIADFHFPSPTTGAEMLADVIANSVTFEDNVGTPAILPIDYTGGTLSSSVDLSAEFLDTPMKIGDLIVTLCQTGVLDVVMVPVEGTPGILAQLQVVDRWGTDKSATMHLDYGTGLFNVAAASRIDSLYELCNRLTYELGPKTIVQDRWQANISGTETGVYPSLQDLSVWQTEQLASRAKYGTFADVHIYDSAAESTNRPLFYELWKTESTFRVWGRDLILVTPQNNEDGSSFYPFADYDIGDSFAFSAAAPLLGPAIEDVTQRIYGYDVDIDAESTVTVSQLIVSADGL